MPTEHVLETPARFELEAPATWWDEARAVFHEADLGLSRPFRADLEAYRIGARLLFRGRIGGEVEMVCGRCAAPYLCAFDEPLELLLEPAADPKAVPESGIQLDPEDLALGQYAGDELDFGPIILEILALVWPMQPRCSESCRGLCPVCGRNRNEESCNCETEEKNRPFAGLDKLLEGSRQNKDG